MSRYTSHLVSAVLSLLVCQVASAAIITSNLRMDDTVSPFSVVNNGAEDYGILGITVRNPTTEAKDVVISLPVSIVNGEGSAASLPAGKLSLRTLTSPASEFTYEQLSLPPTGKVFEIDIPVINQSGSLYEGSLPWGTLNFTLAGIAIEPQSSAFLAVEYLPANGCSLMTFLNDGMSGPNTVPNLDSAWVATTWFTGELVSNREASGFGANSFPIIMYEIVPVPEPAVGVPLAAVTLALLARRTRR